TPWASREASPPSPGTGRAGGGRNPPGITGNTPGKSPPTGTGLRCTFEQNRRSFDRAAVFSGGRGSPHLHRYFSFFQFRPEGSLFQDAVREGKGSHISQLAFGITASDPVGGHILVFHQFHPACHRDKP